MNHYETVFISVPELTEQQYKEEIVAKYRAILVEAGAEILHEENWGLRKLAYPIKKKNNGFYTLFLFKAPGTAIQKLETEFRRNERIMRFLTVALDKPGVEYSTTRRNKNQKNKEASNVNE